MKCSILGVLALCSACASPLASSPSPALVPVPTTITLLPVAADDVTLIAHVLDQHGAGMPGIDVWFSVDTIKHVTDSYGAASYTIPSPPRPLIVRATAGLLAVDVYVAPIIVPPAPIVSPPYEPLPPVQPLPSEPGPHCYPMPQCGEHARNHYTRPLMVGSGEVVPT